MASLPNILRRIRETADAVIAAKPDVLVIIDSPEFTHRVARRVRAQTPSIPIVDYVCPSVWAWRPGRARAMRAYVDHVLALLPFEPAEMKRLGGPPCTYVGHPLSERVAHCVRVPRKRAAGSPIRRCYWYCPAAAPAKSAAWRACSAIALRCVADRVGAIEVVVPSVPRLAEVVRAATASWRHPARIVVEPAEKDAAFRIARAALTKSGTSTLELALAGIPMVAAYRVSFLEAMVARLMLRGQSVILTNLVLGENVIPELLQQYCTPNRLAAGLLPLLSDTSERGRPIAALARLDAIMEIGTAFPSDRAAAVILGCVSGFNQIQR